MAKVKRSNNEVYVYDSNDVLMGYGGVSRSSPLSNFYKTQFNYNGNEFPNSETAIMYTKAQTFGDQTTADKILKCKEPSGAKRLGRKVKPFEPNKWIESRDENVPKILYQKFTQNSKLKEWLISTGNAVLAEIAIEDSRGRIRYKDMLWGIGIGAHHKDIDKPNEWHKFGENYLGKTLMNVRQTIVNEFN